MPKPPERGNLFFDPPIPHRSEKYLRAWELMKEMQISQQVVFSYVGPGSIRGLSFPTKEQALIFKLRL